MLLSIPRPLNHYGDDLEGLARKRVPAFYSKNWLSIFAGEQPKQRRKTMATEEKRSREREQGEEITNELPPKWEPAEGDSIEGFYRGWRMLKVSGNEKPFKIHFIEDEETGEIQSFSGAIADRKMARAPRDAYVWITYLGKVKVGNKGAKAHDYKIQLQKGVSPLPEVLSQESAAQ